MVRLVATDRSNRSHQRPSHPCSPRQVYHVKEKKEEVQSTVDSEKIKADAVVQIGNIKVAVTKSGTGPMVLGKSVDTSVQRPIMADDHEARSSTTTSKYFQPRWCPSGLTHTQKRKLQHLRCQEKKGHEVEKLKAGQLNKCRFIIPQSKVWRVMLADQLAGPVGPPLPTGLTGTADRSDRPDQPVRSVHPVVEQKAESETPVSAPCNEETLLAPSVQDDEELVDHEDTPRMQQHGAQRDFSAQGAKNRRIVIYLMKFLFIRSVCKGFSRL